MPQFSYTVAEKVRFGASFIYIRDDGYYFGESTGAPLLNFAYGSEDKNIGMCLGYNVLNSNENNKKPYIILNGIYRVTNRIALEAEYLRFPEFKSNYLINYGIKFIARNISVDFGFINNSDIYTEILPIGIPFVSFTVRK